MSKEEENNNRDDNTSQFMKISTAVFYGKYSGQYLIHFFFLLSFK